MKLTMLANYKISVPLLFLSLFIKASFRKPLLQEHCDYIDTITHIHILLIN